jgi:hypothetical protein
MLKMTEIDVKNKETLMDFALRSLFSSEEKSYLIPGVPDPEKFEKDGEISKEYIIEVVDCNHEIKLFLDLMKRLHETAETKTIKCFDCGAEYVKLPDPADYDLKTKEGVKSFLESYHVFYEELHTMLWTYGTGSCCEECKLRAMRGY